MIKICFFNLNAYSLFNPQSSAPIGGSEVQLFNIAKYLSKQDDFKISFVTGDWGQKEEIENHCNIKVYKSVPLQKGVSHYLKALFIIWGILKKMEADVFLASSAGVEIGVIALFCKLHNKKFIFRTASSVDCTMEKIKKLGFLKGIIYKYGLRNANKVIVQNEQGKTDLLKYHKKDSVVIKNIFSDSISNERGKEYVLWVGSGRQVKQPDIFLCLCQEFPQEKFVMIMPKSGDETLWNDIYQKTKKIENLEFIERVPFDEIQKYFNQAKIFVGTSEYEGFPNVYIQACLGETPIVSLNVNPDDFISKNDLGYFSENNFEKMVSQVKKLINDPDDYLEKSKNAYAYAIANHSTQNIGKKWENLILELKNS